MNSSKIQSPRPKLDRMPASIQLAAFGDPLFSETDESRGDFRVRSAVKRGLFDGWESLPYSRREVEQIAALYPIETTRTYLGAEAHRRGRQDLGGIEGRDRYSPLRHPWLS